MKIIKFERKYSSDELKINPLLEKYNNLKAVFDDGIILEIHEKNEIRKEGNKTITATSIVGIGEGGTDEHRKVLYDYVNKVLKKSMTNFHKNWDENIIC